MAFQAFNFGKQLGIVGGTLDNKRTSSSDLPPIARIEVEIIGGDCPPGSFPVEIGRELVHHQGGGDDPLDVRSTLRIYRGCGYPSSSGGGGGVGKGPFISGAGAGTIPGPGLSGLETPGGEWRRRTAPVVDLEEGEKADAERAERIRKIIAGLTDPNECMQAGSQNIPEYCCEQHQKEQIAQVLEQLLSDPRLAKYAGLASCLESLLASGKLKVKCTEDVIYDSMNSDAYRDYMTEAMNDDPSITIPSGLLNDPYFVLAPLLSACTPAPDNTDGASYWDAFAILGEPPSPWEKGELCDFLVELLKKSNPNYDLRNAASIPAWGRYSIFDIKTGEVFQIIVDENGNATRGPKIGNWGPCPNL